MANCANWCANFKAKMLRKSEQQQKWAAWVEFNLLLISIFYQLDNFDINSEKLLGLRDMCPLTIDIAVGQQIRIRKVQIRLIAHIDIESVAEHGAVRWMIRVRRLWLDTFESHRSVVIVDETEKKGLCVRYIAQIRIPAGSCKSNKNSRVCCFNNRERVGRVIASTMEINRSETMLARPIQQFECRSLGKLAQLKQFWKLARIDD